MTANANPQSRSTWLPLVGLGVILGLLLGIMVLFWMLVVRPAKEESVRMTRLHSQDTASALLPLIYEVHAKGVRTSSMPELRASLPERKDAMDALFARAGVQDRISESGLRWSVTEEGCEFFFLCDDFGVQVVLGEDGRLQSTAVTEADTLPSWWK